MQQVKRMALAPTTRRFLESPDFRVSVPIPNNSVWDKLQANYSLWAWLTPESREADRSDLARILLHGNNIGNCVNAKKYSWRMMNKPRNALLIYYPRKSSNGKVKNWNMNWMKRKIVTRVPQPWVSSGNVKSRDTHDSHACKNAIFHDQLHSTKQSKPSSVVYKRDVLQVCNTSARRIKDML